MDHEALFFKEEPCWLITKQRHGKPVYCGGARDHPIHQVHEGHDGNCRCPYHSFVEDGS